MSQELICFFLLGIATLLLNVGLSSQALPLFWLVLPLITKISLDIIPKELLIKKHKNMIGILLNSLLITFSLLIYLLPVNAETEYQIHMNDFYIKQEMASQLLKEIEIDLKNGSRERVCARQREAANYGIEATESLIKAFKISGTSAQSEDIKAGLNKWRELRDSC